MVKLLRLASSLLCCVSVLALAPAASAAPKSTSVVVLVAGKPGWTRGIELRVEARARAGEASMKLAPRAPTPMGKPGWGR